MTKQKSSGSETDRSCQHAQTPRRRNVTAYGRANLKRSYTCFLLGTGRKLQASKQDPRPGLCAAVALCITLCGNVILFEWDVQLSSLCIAPNVGDPDITLEENLWLPVHTDINYTQFVEHCTVAASGHSNPHLKVSQKFKNPENPGLHFLWGWQEIIHWFHQESEPIFRQCLLLWSPNTK